MKKSLFVVPFFVLLGACNSGSSNGNGGNQGPKDASGVDTKLQGQFVADEKQPDWETMEKEIYSVGCRFDKENNETKPDRQIDPRLKPGFKVITSTRTFYAGRQFSFKAETVIKDLARNGLGGKFVKHATYPELTGVSGVNPGVVVDSNCEVAADGQDIECKIESGTLLPGNAGEGADSVEYGFSSGETDASNYSRVKGKFKLASGKEVVAYQMIWRSEGKITVKGKDPVPGINETFQIVSNEIPSTDLNYCGGVDVGYYSKTSYKDGSTLNAWKTEILDFQ